MAYKIAVGSSDGSYVDLKFGEVEEFIIYEVDEEIRLLEKRAVGRDDESAAAASSGKSVSENEISTGCEIKSENGLENNGSVAERAAACGGNTESGCGGSRGGCGGNGGGCGGSAELSSRVEAVSDCRCVVCKKIGFQAQKQFEKKAISVFDVDCSVKEALDRITFYYGKIDRHESLGKTSR